jgi:hypothetical protein
MRRSSCVAGFEYFTNPNNLSSGFVAWQSDERRLGTSVTGLDQDLMLVVGGQRLILEEPMVSPSLRFMSVHLASGDVY